MSGSGEFATRELIIPLASTSQPAGPLQQVMSPTRGQGYGMAPQQIHPHLPGGMVFNQVQHHHHLRTRTQVQKVLNPWLREGHLKVQASVSHCGGSTTNVDHHQGWRCCTSCCADARCFTRRKPRSTDQHWQARTGTVSGDAVSGGVVAGDSQVEGFVTPRSQQGLPTIAEMVEGFPASGLQLMTRVGDFFRVARTEVVQVPAVLQGTHATPPRTTTSHTRDSPSGASGPMALGDGTLGSHTSSPPQLGAHG